MTNHHLAGGAGLARGETMAVAWLLLKRFRRFQRRSPRAVVSASARRGRSGKRPDRAGARRATSAGIPMTRRTMPALSEPRCRRRTPAGERLLPPGCYLTSQIEWCSLKDPLRRRRPRAHFHPAYRRAAETFHFIDCRDPAIHDLTLMPTAAKATAAPTSFLQARGHRQHALLRQQHQRARVEAHAPASTPTSSHGATRNDV